jgi:hypothetical protein
MMKESNYQYGGLNPAKFEVKELSPLSSFFLCPVNWDMLASIVSDKVANLKSVPQAVRDGGYAPASRRNSVLHYFDLRLIAWRTHTLRHRALA